MISPNLVIPVFLVGLSIGAIGYAYKEGKDQGTSVCEATILAAKLEQKEKELAIFEQLSMFQQEQIGEAQSQLNQEITRNEKLAQDLDKATSGKPPGCITPGMRDAIKQYRIQTGR